MLKLSNKVGMGPTVDSNDYVNRTEQADKELCFNIFSMDQKKWEKVRPPYRREKSISLRTRGEAT